MDTSVAAGAAIHIRLLSPRGRRKSSIRSDTSPIDVLRWTKIRADPLEGRPTLGSRYVNCAVRINATLK